MTDFRWSQSKVERSRGKVYDFINVGNRVTSTGGIEVQI